jgi:hypothetical protein
VEADFDPRRRDYRLADLAWLHERWLLARGSALSCTPVIRKAATRSSRSSGANGPTPVLFGLGSDASGLDTAAGDIFVAVEETTRPGTYPIGKLEDFQSSYLGDPTGLGLGINNLWLPQDRTIALVGLGAIDSGHHEPGSEVDFSSATGSPGTVTLRADGFGSLHGTLDGYFSGHRDRERLLWAVLNKAIIRSVANGFDDHPYLAIERGGGG